MIKALIGISIIVTVLCCSCAEINNLYYEEGIVIMPNPFKNIKSQYNTVDSMTHKITPEDRIKTGKYFGEAIVCNNNVYYRSLEKINDVYVWSLYTYNLNNNHVPYLLFKDNSIGCLRADNDNIYYLCNNNLVSYRLNNKEKTNLKSKVKTFSISSTYICIVTLDNKIQLMNKSNKRIETLNNISFNSTNVSISPKGNYIAYKENNKLNIIDLKNKNKYLHDNFYAYCWCWTPNEKIAYLKNDLTLLTKNLYSKKINVYDFTNDSEYEFLNGLNYAVSYLYWT